MRLLLIRHGETVHNVAGVYAGITDSALTNHGVLQANRLGAHLAKTGVKITHIFSSDLQRAVKTAEAIRVAQSPIPPETIQLPELREQDFGFYEGKTFFERPSEGNKSGKDAHLEAHRNDPGFVDVETRESMASRSGIFIDAQLVQLLQDVAEDQTVVVVAHGIILSHLWRAILKRFPPGSVSVAQGVEGAHNGFSLQHLGGWSNTGYLDLDIKPIAEKQSALKGSIVVADPSSDKETAAIELVGDIPPVALPQQNSASSSGNDANAGWEGLAPVERPQQDSASLSGKVTDASKPNSDSPAPNLPQGPSIPPPSTTSTPFSPSKLLYMSLVVKAVNSKEHLVGLKKTRGGIGSLKHDSKQKTVDSFFKRQRTS